MTPPRVWGLVVLPLCSAAGLVAGVLVAPPPLRPNAPGQPQELRSISGGVCAGRSAICSVLIDVPLACMKQGPHSPISECPIGFFFHGHGGRNLGFAHSGAGQGVHEHSYIGVYPQGEVSDANSPACCRQDLCKETGEHCGTGWNDGSMTANKCEWNDFDCQLDANDGNFTSGIITTLRAMGASGNIFMWGGSNGANSVQIFAANAGPTMPITAISCGWGQLMAEPPRSGPSPFNWNQPTFTPDERLPGRVGDGRKVAQQAHHGDHDTVIPYQGGPRFGSKIWILDSEPRSDEVWSKHNGCTGALTNPKNTSATYGDRESPEPVQTTAIYWKYEGCPPTAPVEYWQVGP
jgi:hypothetical protein